MLLRQPVGGRTVRDRLYDLQVLEPDDVDRIIAMQCKTYLDSCGDASDPACPHRKIAFTYALLGVEGFCGVLPPSVTLHMPQELRSKWVGFLAAEGPVPSQWLVRTGVSYLSRTCPLCDLGAAGAVAN